MTPISKHHINNEINNEKENNCLLKSYYKKNGHLNHRKKWNDAIIYDNVINYLHEQFQLTKNNENILLSQNGWLKN